MLFPDLAAAVENLRQRLRFLAEHISEDALEDDYLAGKLSAAVGDAERRLGCFLSPVEIIPQGSDEDTDALDEAGTRWVEEPGYDFDPGLFAGETWGLIQTRQRPIISVTRISFAWPAPGLGTAFEVPASWLRIDKKYGTINLVPTQNLIALPLNTFILSAIGGGRRVPLMVQIRYRAGLVNALATYPELGEFLYRMAALGVINDAFLPQSGSISADGLSQSTSQDWNRHQQDINDRLKVLRQRLLGVVGTTF